MTTIVLPEHLPQFVVAQIRPLWVCDEYVAMKLAPIPISLSGASFDPPGGTELFAGTNDDEPALLQSGRAPSRMNQRHFC
jgi:hypothetical protein